MNILFIFQDAAGGVHIGGRVVKTKRTVQEHYNRFIRRYCEQAIEGHDILGFVTPTLLHAIVVTGDARKLELEDLI